MVDINKTAIYTGVLEVELILLLLSIIHGNEAFYPNQKCFLLKT